MTLLRILSLLALSVTMALGSEALAQQSAIHSQYVPENGAGIPVLVLSGRSGPIAYVSFARDLASQGFFSTLVNSNRLLARDGEGEADKILNAIKSSPHSNGETIGVVGFSLGGRLALSHATRMKNRISSVVAYYPQTNLIADPESFVRQVEVPTLILAAVQDRYANCCSIGIARKLAKAASGAVGPRALVKVVEFGQAEHGFNLIGPTYRHGDAATAFQLTVAHLRAGADRPTTQPNR